MTNLIKHEGRGGSEGSSRVLQAEQSARLLFAVQEGPCRGLVDGNRSVILDGTRVLALDRSQNIKGIAVETRPGILYQSPIKSTGGTFTEIPVGAEVSQAQGPATRTIPPLYQEVRVRISFGALSDKKGKKTSVRYQISASFDGGPYALKFDWTERGLATDTITRAFDIPIPAGSILGTDVKVERITADHPDARDQFTWASWVGINRDLLVYPLTAMAQISYNGNDFSTIPDVKLEWYGMSDVQYPSNLTVNDDGSLAGYSTSTWNGTYATGWNSNPVWCCLRALKDTLWGYSLTENLIDKYTFYAIGRWCDEPVLSGNGLAPAAYEPRFSLNCYLKDPEDAYTMLQKYASLWLGSLAWDGSSVTGVNNARRGVATRVIYPGDFDPASLQITRTPVKTRKSVATVKYNNPNLLGEEDFVVVQDNKLIKKYGYQRIDLTAFGCTSRSQAIRYGRWHLYTEDANATTITVNMGYAASSLFPGDIVRFSNYTSLEPGSESVGLIQDVILTTGPYSHLLALDFEPDPNIVGRQVRIYDPSNDYEIVVPVVPAPVANRIKVNPGSGVPIQKGWKVIISDPQFNPQSTTDPKAEDDLFMVIRREKTGEDGLGMIQVVMVACHTIGFDYSNPLTDTPDNPYTELLTPLIRATPLSDTSAIIRWTNPNGSGVSGYDFQWRESDAQLWTSVPVGLGVSYTLKDLEEEPTYSARVRAYGVSRPKSGWATVNFTLNLDEITTANGVLLVTADGSPLQFPAV